MAGGDPTGPRPWRAATAAAAFAAARAALLAPAVATLLWLAHFGLLRWTDGRAWARFPPDFGCDDSKVWDTCTAFQALWLLLPPAAAGAAAVGVVWAGAAAEEGEASHGAGKRRGAGLLARAAAAQLPPARFWAWWCGGLSGADAAVAGGWLAVNALWLHAILKRYYSLADLLARLAHSPRWAIETELTAVGLGALLFPNLLLLFYPVSRGSVLLQAIGLPYPSAIRYHRWLGHWVMIIVTAHSLGFWAVWLALGEWRKEALDFGARVNNLMGGVSFVSGLALWVTSLEAPRRASYSLFYAVHHIGFWGFTLAGLMHYQSMFWYFIPGLLFYAVDAAYRVTQAAGRPAEVLEASAPGGAQASVARLVLACPPYAVAPTGFVWLQAPEISALEWHPFEYVAAPAPKAAVGAALLLHVKAYDRWTRRLVRIVRSRGPSGLWLRAEGPYPEAPAWAQGAGGDDAVVIAAGGIGAAAALSLFAELSPSPGLPVLLVWAARHPAELLLLAPRLAAAVQAKGVALTAHIAYTGGVADLFEASEAACAEAAEAGAAADLAATGAGKEGGEVASSSPMCPALALGGSLGAQATFKLAHHLLACAGAAAAVLLVRALSQVWAPEPWTTAAAGAAYTVAVAAGALLPGIALIALQRAVSALSGRARGGPGAAHGRACGAGADSEPLLSGGEEAGGGEAAGVCGGGAPPEGWARVEAGPGGALLLLAPLPGGGAWEAPLQAGRPDLRALTSAWLAGLKALPAGSPAGGAAPAAAAEAALRVGCYAMGPSGLLAEAQLMCHDMNAAAGRASKAAGSGSGRPVWLRYMQKTHNL